MSILVAGSEEMVGETHHDIVVALSTFVMHSGNAMDSAQSSAFRVSYTSG